MKIKLLLCASLLLVGCGENPFGTGNFSLRNFASFAKKMEKPKSIHEEEGDKENVKDAVAQAKQSVASLSRLSAETESDPDRIGITDEGVEVLNDSQYVYWQEFEDRPSKEDKDKIESGRAEIIFSYDGSPTEEELDGTKITEVYNWSFKGHHEKTWWVGHKDSVEISIDFASGSNLENIKPGFTSFQAWNISDSKEVGQGDTAIFALDSLDV